MDIFERCDHCGHRAYFLITFTFGELALCRHSFMKNETYLRLNAISIEDNSAILNDKTHPTAAVDPLISVADPDEFDEDEELTLV